MLNISLDNIWFQPKLDVSARPLSIDFLDQLATNVSFMQILSKTLYEKIFSPGLKASNLRAHSLIDVQDVYEASIIAQKNEVSSEIFRVLTHID